MAKEEDNAEDQPLVHIGGGWPNEPNDGDDGDAAPSEIADSRVILRRGVLAALLAVRSARFWLGSVALLLVCWCGGLLLVIGVVTGGELPPEFHGWAYILTAAVLLVVSCVLAVRWATRRHYSLTDGHDGRQGPLLEWAAASATGVVFTALSGVFLLLLAFLSGSSPAVAGVAVLLMLLEFMVFSAAGAGAKWRLIGRKGKALAWSVTALFLLGNAMAVVALLPTVRAYETVVVAVNIQRDDLGRIVSYECLPEFRGFVEVYPTERIFWIAASNPLVTLALVAGQVDPQEDSLAWLPGELQSAAEGTQVPCIDGVQPDETGEELPLAIAGMATQVAVAGGLLASSHHATRRQSPSAL